MLQKLPRAATAHDAMHEAVHGTELEHHDTGATVVLGFWVYLMSDCILFAAVFAAYASLSGAMAGNPGNPEMFNLPYVLAETACLLVSSFTYGLAMLAVGEDRQDRVMLWLGITFLLGASFIGLEVNEFVHLVAEGSGPDSSSFMSAFFTLVGTHGCHVTAGLIWMILLMAQTLQRGLTAQTKTRLMCLSLFWHFLDIIWIGVFTVVYLRGAMA
jgi:cytochrome o ubiquinol oxidase subunit III